MKNGSTRKKKEITFELKNHIGVLGVNKKVGEKSSIWSHGMVTPSEV